MNDVPPEFRIYISQDEVNYYKDLGVTIYEGPRGGLYVDVREVEEKQTKQSSINDIFKLREKADNLLTKVMTERLRPVKEEEVKELSDMYYELNKKRNVLLASKVSGAIDKYIVRVEEMEGPSLNGERMKKVFLEDGSVIYVKPLNSGFEEVSWLTFNNVLGSRLLKLFGGGSDFAKFVPNISIVTIGDEIYVAVEEVMGILGGDAGKRGFPFIITDETYSFLIASMLTGLWDVNGSNFMVIPDRGIIIPFDIDFIGSLNEDVFIGPLDGLDYFKEVRGTIDSEKIVKEVEELYLLFNDKIEKIVDSIVDEYRDYLLKSGFELYDIVDIKMNYLRHWKFIGKLLDWLHKGKLSYKDVLTLLSIDDGSPTENREFIKEIVPARYRIYVNNWQAQRLRRHGIRIYRGPRGGLYADIRELRRKNVDLNEGSANDDNKDEIIVRDDGKLVLEDVRKIKMSPNMLSKLRSILGQSLDFAHEKLVEYKLGRVSKDEMLKNLVRGLNSAFILNANSGKLESTNLLSEKVNVVDLRAAGVSGGQLNAGSMKIFEFPDGSRIFAKKIDWEFEQYIEYAVNNLVAPIIVRRLVGDELASFIPVSRIIRGGSAEYIGLSEVFGFTVGDYLNLFDTSYLDDESKERLKKFLAAYYAVGADDVFHNVFIDLINGTFVQFDYDMMFNRGLIEDEYVPENAGNHITDTMKWLFDDVLDLKEIMEEGVRLVIENYDAIMNDINTAKKYALIELGNEKFKKMEPYFDDIVKWFETIKEMYERHGVEKTVLYLNGKDFDHI